MPGSTLRNISYPLPDDLVKDAGSSAKLASDLQMLAQTADDAIAGEFRKFERGVMPYNTDVSSWVDKTQSGWWDIPNAAIAQSIIGLPPDVQGMPGRFYHSAAATGIPFQIFMTYGSGGTRTQQGVYYRTIIWFDLPYGEWVNLAGKQSGLGDGGSPEHMMRESEMRRRRGVKNTRGKAGVTLIFDHGTNNFNSLVLPALKFRGLKSTLALNSQMYDPAQSRYVHDNLTNWTMIKGWANNDGVEIANHGRTHNNFQDAAGIENEVRGGREELETNLGFPIDSYVQVGLGKPGFGGFDNGETPEAYWETAAGQIILSAHAVATGSLPAPKFYPMDGTITQGMSGFWIDAGSAAISSAQTQIQTAISTGQGVVIRCHPEVLNVGANTTTAQLTDFFDWLKTQVDNGLIEVLQLRDFAIAERGPARDLYTVSETAGRTVSIWDYLNNREQLIYGDTGWRTITPVNASSGSVQIRRIGNTVTARTIGIVVVPGGGQVAYAVLPSGFRASATNAFGWVSNVSTNSELNRIQAENNGLAWIGDFTGARSTRPTFAFEGELSWVTDDIWPTSLPGVAA